MSLAWHTAYFHRVEKMPRLTDVLIRERSTQNSDRDKAAALRLAANAFGGVWKPHNPNDRKRRIVRG